MRNTLGKASRQMRSPRAFVAFVCSALILSAACAAPRTIVVRADPLPAQPPKPLVVPTSSTATSTASLFNFNISLERATALVGPGGVEYIGFPAAEAEAMLEVFEHRIPLMKSVIARQETLSSLLTKQVRIHEAMLVESSSVAAGWKELAGVWKTAAEAGEPSWYERIFLSKELWLIMGVVGGAALTKLIID